MVETIYNPLGLCRQEINHIFSLDFHRADYSKPVKIGAYLWKIEGSDERLVPGSMVWKHHDRIFRSKDGSTWELIVEQVC